MKDKVFIAWSGDNNVARRVKRMLADYGYEGIVGGNESNDSSRFTIGDVIVDQMEKCNQAILILQKKHGKAIVSSNLFFEMGYVFSKYGARKVHAVKRESEKLNIPTDIENFFIEPVPDLVENDKNKSFDEELFAKGIVDYFLKRQQLTVGGSKMELINNYNKLLKYIKREESCSNYELAQYVLYFMQSAYLFDEVENASKALDSMCCALGGEIQHELSVAVNICRAYFRLIKNIRVAENTEKLYIEKAAFNKYINTADDLIIELNKLSNKNKRETDKYGNIEHNLEEYIFDSFAKVFLYEHLTYACVLCAENPEASVDDKEKAYTCLIGYAKDAEECLSLLGNNQNFSLDENGFFALCRAYISRNEFFAYRGMEQNEDNIQKAKEALSESGRFRNNLLNQYENNEIDSRLYSYFCMEYHLLLVDRVKYLGSLYPTTEHRERIDSDLSLIFEYAKSLRKEQVQNKYKKKILAFYLGSRSGDQTVSVEGKYVEEILEAVITKDEAGSVDDISEKFERTATNI